jgi:hypothetical protein
MQWKAQAKLEGLFGDKWGSAVSVHRHLCHEFLY